MPRLVITLLVIGGLWWDVPGAAQEVDSPRRDRARPAFGVVPGRTEVAARQALTIQLAASVRKAVDRFIKADNRGDVSTSVRTGGTQANAPTPAQGATLSVRVGMFVDDVTENLLVLFRTMHSDHYTCTPNVKAKMPAARADLANASAGPVQKVIAETFEKIQKSCPG